MRSSVAATPAAVELGVDGDNLGVVDDQVGRRGRVLVIAATDVQDGADHCQGQPGMAQEGLHDATILSGRRGDRQRRRRPCIHWTTRVIHRRGKNRIDCTSNLLRKPGTTIRRPRIRPW